MAKGCAMQNYHNCHCKKYEGRDKKAPTVSGVANEYLKQAHCPYYVELPDEVLRGRSNDEAGANTEIVPAKPGKPRGRPRTKRPDAVLSVE